MPKVKVNGINIYYEIRGAGEPLVFIMGGSDRTDSWGPQIQVFSKDYRLLVFDNRGGGRSDAPDVAYSIETMARDVAGLLDAFGIDKAHIRGVSAGGLTAQLLALNYPEKVISIVLQGTTCGGPHAPFDEEALNPFLNKELSPEERADKLIWLTITDDFARANPSIVQQIKSSLMATNTFTPGKLQQIEAFASADTYERLPEIKAPTLVLGGEADRVTPPEYSRILASRIPNAELVVFPNTGHMFLEAGQERNQVILDFLKRNSISKKGG